MERRRLTLAIASGVALVGVVVAIVVLLVSEGDDGPAAASTAASSAEAAAPNAIRINGRDPVTGERVRLSDYAGKPVVLNFWASWCAPCRDELPALVRFADVHPEAAVVGVNLQDDPAGAKALHRQTGVTFPSIADPNARIAEKLGLNGMPTTFFLDERHVVVGKVEGGTDLAGFEEAYAQAGLG